MDPALQNTLAIRRKFSAPPAEVFRACIEPALMQQWWGPPGYTTPVCEIDARVGGQYHLVMKSADGPEHSLRGEYREILPNERLVYTFVWQEGEYAHHQMLVTMTFKATDDGTELDFTQTKLPTEQARADHEQGWCGSFDRLTALVGG